jgi:divalent metal cation (Fe/Co/Zn/Cd) transporter
MAAIGFAVGSVIRMPILGLCRTAWPTRSGALRPTARAARTSLCAYLAGALLVGLLDNALVGAWWLDRVVGLLIATVTVKEGAKA